ncbi:transglutaminase TgpA family protein [Streptosporangium saharense]|uniref:Transglutaminase-like putative cysteine protease n=1 Tax=Streptosporangium saharense TaxID=1706840 RepID=A0A7W7QLQ6_9ACTN|nr:DUF3488 and transglutaminase-like domain-containing protein [Streptosporangium saharense]MBB4915857.1 transglutaminase-like putative cysteine protease [Streptosporangium saharense]
MRLPIAAGAATMAVTIALYPLFQGGAWFWASLGAVAVVTAVGVPVSRYSLPPWLAPLGQAVAIWIYLTAVFSPEKAWARVVPTRESAVGLAKMLVTGFADIQRFAAPVPAKPAITLLTCAGVALIAIVVDVLASRTRRAALCGLPLLALFTVPAAVATEPISWPAFILAAVGYLGLLVADGRERVGHWGRAVLVRRSSVTSRAVADVGPLRLSGKRIGLTAVVLAILLPALLPTLEPSPLFGFGVGNGRGKGTNSISISNPIVSLRGELSLPNNSEVLSYTTTDNLPRYLRMYALDIFDGQQWTMTGSSGLPEDRISQEPLPPPPGQSRQVPAVTVTTKITVSPAIRGMEFLPLPYPPSRVQVEGDWRPDRDTLMVFSTEDTAGGLTYTVVSDEPKPTAEALRSAAAAPREIAERYLQLPRDLPREVRDLAVRETAGETNPYERAIKLQEFFTSKGGFTYTLAAQGHDEQALTDFLIRNRAGYCEQFAASMAVLARVLGIPARVAVGYTGGAKLGERWQVRTHDSHAWPELYFEGTGWLRFEPTPAGLTGQGSATVPAYSRARAADAPDDQPSAAPATGSDSSDPASGSASNPRNRRPDLEYGGSGPIVVEEGTPLAARIGLGVVAAALVALIPAMLRWQLRARRRRVSSRAARPAVVVAEAPGAVTVRTSLWHQATTATWAELCDTLYDHGVSRGPSESPRALAVRLAAQHGFDAPAEEAVTRIATSAERMLFARTPGENGPTREDLRVVRRALAASVPRGRRIRAVLLPPSTLARARAVGTGLLDVFDRLENLRLTGRKA